MARVLLAWELGANLGHIMPMRALAQHLVQQGHQCVFVVRDLRAAEEALGSGLGPVLQAPVVLTQGRNPVNTQISYTSLINNSGFDDILGLASRLRAWRNVFEVTAPEVMIADHSPTALLAARTIGLPCLHIGTGFTVPPLQQPFPAFQPGIKVTLDLLAKNEAAVLQNVRQALERLQLPPISSLQDILSHAQSFVLSYPELDHYGLPRSEPYIGLPDIRQGAHMEWPAGNAPRILAYLRPCKTLPSILNALQRSRARVLVRVGDISAARLAGYTREGMRITNQPVDMHAAGRECDAYVSYGSHGFVGEMLLAGKPGLLLPTVLERTLVTRRVVQLGAAITPPPQEDFNLSAALEKILEDTPLRQSAQRFAQAYQTHPRGLIMPRLAQAALSLTHSARHD